MSSYALHVTAPSSHYMLLFHVDECKLTPFFFGVRTVAGRHMVLSEQQQCEKIYNGKQLGDLVTDTSRKKRCSVRALVLMVLSKKGLWCCVTHCLSAILDIQFASISCYLSFLFLCYSPETKNEHRARCCSITRP